MSEAHLGCSIRKVEDEGGGQALVRPASKVHQLHAEAAAEPHHIAWPQVAVHYVSLVQPTHCLAHLHTTPTTQLQHTASIRSLTMSVARCTQLQACGARYSPIALPCLATLLNRLFLAPSRQLHD